GPGGDRDRPPPGPERAVAAARARSRGFVGGLLRERQVGAARAATFGNTRSVGDERGLGMRWAWRLGTFNGIAVYIHVTFLVLIGWVLLSQMGAGLGNALLGVLFVLLVFACVVLHEFGHAVTAQRFGIQTRDITLYPIGGVARLER